MHQRRNDRSLVNEHTASLAFQAMGCRFEIFIDPEGSPHNRLSCQAIAEEMRDLVLDWHYRLSIFEPNSTPSHIKCTPAGIKISVNSDMFALFMLCEELRIKTHGAFNIALDHNHIFALNLRPRKAIIRKTNDRTILDFGAIAKGFVLDLIRDELREYGITNAFIHGGTSSVLAMGTNPWSIQIDGYRVQMHEHAAGISELHSQRNPHIIDPFTNKPLENAIEQIVCIHKSAAVADAYATACCVTPTLVEELSADPCTFIVKTNNSTTLHDPLGVVQTIYKDAT